MYRVQKPLEVHGQDLSDLAFGDDVLDLKGTRSSTVLSARSWSQVSA